MSLLLETKRRRFKIKIKVNNIKIVRDQLGTPSHYRVEIEVLEPGLKCVVTISVEVDVKKGDTIEEVEAQARAEGKKFLEKAIPIF